MVTSDCERVVLNYIGRTIKVEEEVLSSGCGLKNIFLYGNLMTYN